MDIRFSVIIPVYNAEVYVGEAIESALRQKNCQFEIIVVNDGSTDRSLEVIKQFGSYVKIVNKENGGVAAARNSGFYNSSCNFLAFLDADDIWLPDKLYMQSLKINEGFKIVYTNRYNIGQIGDLPELQSEVMAMSEGDLWENLLLGNMITASSSVIESKLFGEHRGFNGDLWSCEDWDLWLRCAENTLIGYCPEPLVKYRIHSGGLSKNYQLMSSTRMEVIYPALRSDRASNLTKKQKRKILARTWATSGWDAAKSKDLVYALKLFSKAIWIWPFDYLNWYAIARSLTGRV